jgi:2-octaprenylphenol hydroxylase
MNTHANASPADTTMRVTVLVCGSGTVAHTTAIAMANRGISTLLCHHHHPAVPSEGIDERIFAITPPNIRFLESLGFWQRLLPSRLSTIAEMRIHPHPRTKQPLKLAALTAGVSALSVLVEQRELLRVGGTLIAEIAGQSGALLKVSPPIKIRSISQTKEAVTVTLEDGSSLVAQAMIVADGAESAIRRLMSIPTQVDDYGDACLVGNFSIERPHRNIATQWFYPEGVIATLPLPQDHISLAWSCRQQMAEAMLQDRPALLAAMHRATEGYWGAFTPRSAVRLFPLRRMKAERQMVGRVILAGDSAHTVHPMLGLGLNLGLGDVSALMNHFGSIPALQRLGQSSLMERSYKTARAIEVGAIQTLTHCLHHTYLRQQTRLPKVASLGMGILNRIPLAKTALIRAMTH